MITIASKEYVHLEANCIKDIPVDISGILEQWYSLKDSAESVTVLRLNTEDKTATVLPLTDCELTPGQDIAFVRYI